MTLNTTAIIFVRIALVIGLPFIMLWSFVSTLVKEIWRAFQYAWLDVCLEWHSFREQWKWLGDRDGDKPQ